MFKTEIELPESAKEYLSTVLGKFAVLPVVMKDRRLLMLSYELIPRHDCKGNPISESDKNCPVCGWPI